MDKENLRKMVAANLRSVTQSCKGGVPFDRLERDYRDLLGVPIPYRDLGYNSLETMIRGMPDVINVDRNASGQMVALGVADEATAHIVSLVSKQKAAVSRKMSRQKRRPFRIQTGRGPPTRFSPQHRYPSSSFQSRSFKYDSTSTFDKSRESSTSTFNKSRLSSTSTFDKSRLGPHVLHQEQEPVQQDTSFANSTSFPAKSQPFKKGYEIAPRFLRMQQQGNQNVQECVPPPIEPPPILYSPQTPLKFWSTRETRFSDYGYESQTPFLSAVQCGDSGSPSRIPSPKPKSSKKKRASNNLQPLPPLPTISSAKDFIEDYASRHCLIAKYQTLPVGKKKKLFISTLTLGSKKYHSYPVELPSEGAAEEEAAKSAVDAMKENEEHNAKFVETSMETPEDVQKLILRIEEVIAEKHNGIWSMGVPAEYEAKFSELLPAGWLQLIEQNSSIDIEQPTGLQHIPKDAVILRCSVKCASGTVTPSSSSSEACNVYEDDAISLGQRTARISLDTTVNLPDGNQWAVFVSDASSTVNIAVRLVDQAEQLAEMSEQMMTYYKINQSPVQTLTVMKLYAAQLDDAEDGLWHRVLLEEIKHDSDQVICYFVDEGDTSILKLSNLQELDTSFESLPYQALNVKLYGLEEYSNLVKLENLEDKLLARTLIADVINRDKNSFNVVLYDTSGDDDVNMNEVLLQTTVTESLISDLPEVGTTSMSYLTHSTSEGDVFLRFCCPHYSLLEAELEKLIPIFEETAAMNQCALSKETIYAAKFIDNLWYRAVVNDTREGQYQVEVLYVDYGNTCFVSQSHICALEPISPFLASLPFQAVRCSLNEVPPSPNLKWTEEAIEKLKDLAPHMEELIVKVEHPATDSLPAKVSLFKRNESSIIISINQTLAFNKELFRATKVKEPHFGKKIRSKFDPPLPSTASKSRGLSLPLHMEKNVYSTSVSLSSNIPDVALTAAVAEEQMAKRLGTKEGLSPSHWAVSPEFSTDQLNEFDNIPPLSPDIPEIGKLFDVYVTLAASPTNFVVQPYKSSLELDNLQQEMQHFYSMEENVCEMHSCLLKEGHFYAVQHTDKTWYRARVKDISTSDPIMLTVHFVDFGDFAMIPMANIQPLWRQFKGLPCQAIKASLAGVKPRCDDWEAMECITFRDMVEEKTFVAVIRNRRVNCDSDFGGITLELTLVDTSIPNQDVYVDQLLINKKLAVQAS